MEIKVGEYVRTKNGEIAKIIEIAKSIGNEAVYRTDEDITTNKITVNCLFDYDLVDIVKHSKNIIDLIQVGDYVNGMLVTEIGKMHKVEIGKMHKVINVCFYNGLYANNLTLVEADIKSIVTKESFASVEYKV